MPPGVGYGGNRVNPNRFAMSARGDVPRSAFDVQFTHKTTFNAPLLIPIYVDEVLPGDSHRVKMTAFARLSTPIVPLMDNIVMESFFFFVPYRLIWTNWQRMMGEQQIITDSTQFLTPLCVCADAVIPPQAGGICGMGDYMGITNNGSGNPVSVIAFPFRAYNLIWNQWFRDEDLQNPVVVSMDDGPDDLGTDYPLLARGKRHDYFTSARPWPAKPIPNMNFWSSPGISHDHQNFMVGGDYQYGQIGAPVTGLAVPTAQAAQVASGALGFTGGRTGTYGEFFDNSQVLVMRAQGATGNPDIRVLVNDLRTADMIQRMMEINARGGTRYTEIVQAHFGVRNPDSRLQRSEYLGGGRTFITVNPIAQTSASGIAGTSTVLGEQAGVASFLAHNHGFSQSFTEHGVVLGLVSIRSDLTYQQGVERMWKRRTPFDFYWPGLAHLGEQAVMKGELYTVGSTADIAVFGYQERWSEYKWHPSRTSGYFRSTVPTPLDEWHLAQEFVAAPSLNAAFVVENPPIDRVLQVATNYGQQFLMDAMFDVRYVRAMPMFSVPGVGGRI